MVPALSIDRHRGPPLPIALNKPQPRPQERLQSPLPPEWSNSTKSLRELANIINELGGDE